MSESSNFSTFPDSTIEGLALLWTKTHATEAETPQAMCQMYWDAYYKISLVNRETSQEAKARIKG